MKSSLLIILICSTNLLFSQNYDFSNIDNEGWQAIKRNGVKKCITRHKKYQDEKLISDKIDGVYYYNKQGLCIQEYSYNGSDTTANKWIISAQYDKEGRFLTEQWIWEDPDQHDSIFYIYDDQMRIVKIIENSYEGDTLDYTDVTFREHYKDSVVEKMANSDVLLYELSRGDTLYTFYPGSGSQFIEVNKRMISYTDGDYVGAKTYVYIYEFDDATGLEMKYSIVDQDGNLIEQIEYFYKGDLMIKYISNNFKKGTKTIATFEYEYFE